MDDSTIVEGLQALDTQITKKYFYGYCRRAYEIFDRKYQLKNKEGLDFYSLAHDYYIRLLTNNFKQLEDRPADMKLSTWMTGGFRFVVLDALKAYSIEFEKMADVDGGEVIDYVRGNEGEPGLMFEVAEAVADHYHDRTMQEIAHKILYAGYKQKEVAQEIGLTPAAVNQRVKKMMNEVIIPYVVENYSKGLFAGVLASKMSVPTFYEERPMPAVAFADESQSVMLDINEFDDSFNIYSMDNTRVTPNHITTLRDNEIFVFGSNLQGLHGGGAARTARLNFGAEMGNGVGLQGQSYAIPTMQGGVETIKPYVDEFIAFAKENKQLHFFVTPIGCGIAGFEPSDIAPLFADAQNVENISLPQSFWEIL